MLPLFLFCQLATPSPSLPPVSLDDLARFPDRLTVRREREQNAHARKVCLFEASTSTLHGSLWWELHVELKYRDQPWELLHDALWEPPAAAVDHAYDRSHARLQKLRELRKAVGPAAYSRGAIPPGVPPSWVELFR